MSNAVRGKSAPSHQDTVATRWCCASLALASAAMRLTLVARSEGLVGSRAHVAALVAQQQPPEAALVLDMVGFASNAENSQDSPVRIPLLAWVPYTGNFILDAGNWSSGWLGNLFEACIDAYTPELPYFSMNRLAGWFADSARSDHASYWAAGIDAIVLNDTAEFRNANYHKATDLPATLDAVFLRRNAQAVLATMLHWAGS